MRIKLNHISDDTNCQCHGKQMRNSVVYKCLLFASVSVEDFKEVTFSTTNYTWHDKHVAFLPVFTVFHLHKQ